MNAFGLPAMVWEAAAAARAAGASIAIPTRNRRATGVVVMGLCPNHSADTCAQLKASGYLRHRDGWFWSTAVN
jgi:hypothetical protein